MFDFSTSKVGFIYGMFLVLIMAIIGLFLLCDFQILSEKYCSVINEWVNVLTKEVNKWTGAK